MSENKLSKGNKSRAGETAVNAPVKAPAETKEVLVVFACNVKACKGKGFATAVVAGKDGTCDLYGVTMLARKGFIGEGWVGKTVKAQALGELLHKPVIIGADAARKYLADHKLTLNFGQAVLG